MLKLYDKDLGIGQICDDLIGVINLPVSLLDLSQESGKLYTCLIVHDSCNGKAMKSSGRRDVARMNLKISAQCSEIFSLKLELVSKCNTCKFQVLTYAIFLTRWCEARALRKV